jgi:hypothetical protein
MFISERFLLIAIILLKTGEPAFILYFSSVKFRDRTDIPTYFTSATHVL